VHRKYSNLELISGCKMKEDFWKTCFSSKFVLF